LPAPHPLAIFLPLFPSLSKDGLNQTRLGKAVGRSLPLILSLSKDVSNYERAQRRLDLPDLILVCRAISIEPAEILRRLEQGED
jgi:hypothetical protein